MSVLVERRRSMLEVSRPQPGRLFDLAAVGLPGLLGLILCLYDLNARSLWLDEAASISIASQHGAAFGAALAHDGGNMLGYYGLLHVLIGLFGTGSLVVRLPSALAGGATVALTSLIGLRLFNRRVAAVTGILAAVSLPLVYWGQDARGYEPMIAFVCASFLLLVIALQRPTPGWGLWLGFVATTVAGVYMGLEAVLVCPVQLALLLWYRRHARWLISALIVAGACCIPLAVLALDRGSGQIFWIPPPYAFTTRQILLTLGSAGLEPQFYSGSGDVLLRLTELIVILGGLTTVGLIWRSRTRTQAWRPVVIVGWLMVPLALTWVISEVGHSIWEARYLLISLPAVALVLAWLLVGLAAVGPGEVTVAWGRLGLARRWPLREATGRLLSTALRALAALMLVALLTLRALQLVPSYGVSTEPWRAVTAHVLAASRPGDCIAFYPLDARMPFRYYLPANAQAPRSILPALPWAPIRPFVEDYSSLSPTQLARASRRCGRVWLVAGHEGGSETSLGRLHYIRYQALVAGLDQRYLHSSSRTFGQAQIITLELFSQPVRKTGASAF
jgi:hypothetical protein